MLTISLNASTPTSVTVDVAGRTPATYDTLEFQYCARKDFSFALAPIAPFATSSTVAMTNLNQGNTYSIRARERDSSTSNVGAWADPIQAYTPVSVAQDTTPLSIMQRPALLVVPEPVNWMAFGYDTGHPPDNLGSDSPSEQLWVTETGWLGFDSAGQPIDTIALMGTNVPAVSGIHLLAYPTKAGRDAQDGSHTYTLDLAQFQASPGLPGRPSYHGLIRLPAPRNERYWALGFTDLPPGNITAITFAVVGLARTAKNIAADKVETPLDYGGVERTRDGIPDRRYGWRGRRVDFEIAVMTEAQWETQFSDLRHKIGLTDPVLVVPNTRAGAFLHDRILYGPLSAQRATQPYTPRFTQGFTVDSLI
jgi:hypothetical protein